MIGFDDGMLAFHGRGGDGQVGIYLEVDGTLSALVDTSTPVPHGGGTFFSLSDNEVSFAARVTASTSCVLLQVQPH